MAHFIGFPYLSKGFLPCFEYGLFVIFCLAILQFVFFDCCSVDVHCKYLGLWNGIFVFLRDMVSLFLLKKVSI